MRLRILTSLDGWSSTVVRGGAEGFAGSVFAGKVVQKRTGFRGAVLGEAEPAPAAGTLTEAGKAVARLGAPVDRAVLDRVRGSYDRLISDDRFVAVDGAGGSQQGEHWRWVITPGRNVYGSANTLNVFEHVSGLDELVDALVPAVREYYGSHVRLLNVQLRRTHHVPPELQGRIKTYPSFWHLDPHPIDHVKVFVALSHIDHESGPFHYVPFSETQRLLRKYAEHEDRIPDEHVRREADVRMFTGPPGSAILCNTNLLLHRAGIPQPGRRRDMVILQLAPASRSCRRSWSEQCTYGVVQHTQGLVRRLTW